MNGNDHLQQQLLDHETRISRLEEAVKHIMHSLARIESELTAFRHEMRAEQQALRESLERQMEALRQEFHRDRRFSAMVFLTTQLAVIAALLRLAGVF